MEDILELSKSILNKYKEYIMVCRKLGLNVRTIYKRYDGGIVIHMDFHRYSKRIFFYIIYKDVVLISENHNIFHSEFDIVINKKQKLDENETRLIVEALKDFDKDIDKHHNRVKLYNL